MTRNMAARESLALLLSLCVSTAFAAETTAPSKTRRVLDEAGEQGKYTFILFHKEDSAATQAMGKVLTDGIGKRSDRAVLTRVLLTDKEEQLIVSRFDVGRAPMPLTIAVAPNGAITGIFQQRLADSNIDDAFVTPTMMKCMKSMQEGKVVIVCVQPGTATTNVVPQGVKELQLDPQFKSRLVILSAKAQDPAETKFYNQVQINPKTFQAPTAVFLAPPGVLVGKYDTSVTAAQLSSALHHATHSCNDPNCKDPNCKHHHPQGTTGTAPAAPPRSASTQPPVQKRK